MMKNKFLVSALSVLYVMFSSSAWADIKIVNALGQQVVVPTSADVKLADNIPDVFNAIGVGDKDFLMKVLKKDPKFIETYNNSNPEDILGFNAYDLDTINLVLKSDPNLLGRMQSNNRNIASTMLFNHWDELTHEKDIKYFLEYEKTIADMGIKMKPGTTLLKKDRRVLEDLALATSANMPTQVLNQKDVFGNTTLHYAVGRNLLRLVNYLINESKFTVKPAFNNYGETAIFMLIDNSCELSSEDKKNAQEILRTMVKARMSLFQKNISGFSFPALVYGLPKLEYLQEVLDSELSDFHKRVFKKEALLVKQELGKGDNNKLYSSIQRNGYWTNSCRYFEEKNNAISKKSALDPSRK